MEGANSIACPSANSAARCCGALTYGTSIQRFLSTTDRQWSNTGAGFANGFTVSGRGTAEILLVGGGGGGGDGNPGGGGGGGGAVVVGNMSLIPGQYRITVGFAGGPTAEDREGSCGHNTILAMPDGHAITAAGGAGGSGYRDPSRCGSLGGGGGAGPNYRGQSEPTPPNDWPDTVSYSSAGVENVNATEHRHNVSIHRIGQPPLNCSAVLCAQSSTRYRAETHG